VAQLCKAPDDANDAGDAENAAGRHMAVNMTIASFLLNGSIQSTKLVRLLLD